MESNLKKLIDKMGAGFKRFPLTIICSAVATFFAMNIAYHEFDGVEGWFYRCLLVFLLGMPLFTAQQLFAERRKMGRFGKGVLISICALVLGAISFSFTASADEFGRAEILRFLFPLLAFFALLFSAPYIGNKEKNGFWQFNKSLILRIMSAVVSAGIIFAALSLALVSIDQLFEFRINDKFFAMLWSFLAIFFSTVFVHIEIPSEYKKLDQDKTYPVILKNFANYILLPIISVYFVILTVYFAKFLISQSWPSGTVAMPIMIFSILGIVSYVLLWPIKNAYSKYFFPILLPFLGIYFLALGKRISEYGVTEPRYFGLMFGVWLLFISIYFIASKEKTLKVGTLSIAVLAILSVYGPWDAFNTSRISQISRLENLLNEYSILNNGKIQKVDPATVPDEVEVEISSIISYLDASKDMKYIKDWFSDGIEGRRNYLEAMGLKYRTRVSSDAVSTKVGFNVLADSKEILDVSNYKYFFETNNSIFLKSGVENVFSLGEKNIYTKYDNDSKVLTMRLDDGDSLSFDIAAFAKKLYAENKDKEKGTVSKESMSLSAENSQMEVKIYLNSIGGFFEDGELESFRSTENSVFVNLK